MKPIEVIIEGFGPFPKKEVVDFRKLENGLFLITGDTGAGKTTIFDAITYALYGEPSGDNRKANMIRSDFAGPEDDTRVTLSFSNGSNYYKLKRNPAYERKSKRGDGVAQQVAEAELYDCTSSYEPGQLPDEKKGVAIAVGISDVTAKVEEILGINREQFVNVSMIAQGEFLKLLLAKSEKRAEIFRSIFKTGIYKHLQLELKSRALRLKNEKNMLKSSLFQYINGTDVETESEITDLIKKENVHIVDSFLEALEGIILKDTEELKTIKSELTALRQKQKKLHEKRVKAEEAQKDYNQYVTKLEKSKKEKEGLVPKLQEAKDILLKSQEELDRAQELKVKATVINNSLGTYEVLEELSRELVQREKALAQVNKELKSNEVLQEKCQKEIAKVGENREKLNNQYNELSEEKKRTSLLYEDMLDEFLRSQAGILANRLKPGEPCPVCGSREHPDKQQLTKEVCTEAQLNAMKAKRDKMQSRLEELAETLSRCGRQETELAGRLLEYKANKEEIDKKLGEIAAGISAVKAQIDTGKGQLEYGSLSLAQKAGEDCLKEAKAIEDQVENARKSRENLALSIKLLEERIAQEQEIVLRKSKKLMDIEGIRCEERELQKEVNGRERLEQQYNIRLNKNSAGKLNVEKTYNDYREKAGEWEICDNLSTTANGGVYTQGKYDFESYVQAKYFEQVIGFANDRLGRMTQGRYELIRRTAAASKAKKTGLELDVLDNNTGKIRPGETLSGGEAFMAALSMALGMSDAIASNAGGIKLESMFIDEGFGSLDANSMEQAMLVLGQLGGSSGRMVGIISHIEAVKSRIDNRIVVERELKGSKIRQ